jgi:hypothetical protein
MFRCLHLCLLIIGAFIIWGVIYTLDALFLVYQFFWPQEDVATLLHDIGFWYIGVCTLNLLWIVVFAESTVAAFWICDFILVGCLFCLCKIYNNTNCWRSSRAGGIWQRVVIDVHFSMYASWVTIATILNITISFAANSSHSEGTASAFGFIMLMVVLVLDTYIVVTRRDFVWGLVYAWACYWIYVRHSDDGAIVAGALISCVCIALVSALVAFKTAREGIQSTTSQRHQDGGERSDKLGDFNVLPNENEGYKGTPMTGLASEKGISLGGFTTGL